VSQKWKNLSVCLMALLSLGFYSCVSSFYGREKSRVLTEADMRLIEASEERERQMKEQEKQIEETKQHEEEPYLIFW